MTTRKHGFTLIELLVVIAIIAILAAILFPIFAAAKESARIANCQSNIKQIGTAMQMYADANGGRLPRFHNRKTGVERELWWDYIRPYLKADKIYRCPALPKSRGEYEKQYGEYGRVFGYGVNHPHLFDAGAAGAPELAPRILTNVSRPSKTMLMCDSYTAMQDEYSPATIEAGYPVVYCRHTSHNTRYTGQMPDGNVAGRHGGSSRSDIKPYGKTVVLYCDLHVKAWPKEYLITKYNTREESGNDDIWGHFDAVNY